MKQKPIVLAWSTFFSAFLTILLVIHRECAGDDRSSRSNRCCPKSVWSGRSGTGYARIRQGIRREERHSSGNQRRPHTHLERSGA